MLHQKRTHLSFSLFPILTPIFYFSGPPQFALLYRRYWCEVLGQWLSITINPVSNYITTFDENWVKKFKKRTLLLFKLQPISYKLFEKNQIHWSIIVFPGYIIHDRIFYKPNSHNSALEKLHGFPPYKWGDWYLRQGDTISKWQVTIPTYVYIKPKSWMFFLKIKKYILFIHF